MRRVRFAVAAAALLLVAQSSANITPRISIIIDDLGYRLADGRRAIELPGPVAYAILPETPGSRRLAELAKERGKEVLLHLPLEAVDHDGPPEPGGIVLDMSRTGFSDAFANAIDSVPFAIGVSSHRAFNWVYYVRNKEFDNVDPRYEGLYGRAIPCKSTSRACRNRDRATCAKC